MGCRSSQKKFQRYRPKIEVQHLQLCQYVMFLVSVFPSPIQKKKTIKIGKRARGLREPMYVLTDSLRSQFIKVSLGLPTVTPELQNLIYCKKQNILFFLSGDDRFAKFLHFFTQPFCLFAEATSDFTKM